MLIADELSVDPALRGEALIDGDVEAAVAASRDSRRRTAELIDASYPEFTRALRYSLKASSDRSRGFSASYVRNNPISCIQITSQMGLTNSHIRSHLEITTS